jgi:hypothetical protein
MMLKSCLVVMNSVRYKLLYAVYRRVDSELLRGLEIIAYRITIIRRNQTAFEKTGGSIIQMDLGADFRRIDGEEL